MIDWKTISLENLAGFVSSPVAVGKEIISNFQDTKVATGTIQMLRAEDSGRERNIPPRDHRRDRPLACKRK